MSALQGQNEIRTEDYRLTASDWTNYRHFGQSVSVSGDVAVVGWPLDDNSVGSAYVFRYDGIAWIEEAKLLSSDGTFGDYFGKSVSVSGEVVVVGATSTNASPVQSGSAYVFRYDGTTWVEEAKLLASDAEYRDFFGSSVSVSGDVAVVGAEGNDDSGDDSGSAYVFRYDGSTWVEEVKLVDSRGSRFDKFGWSVAVSGDVAMIGVRSGSAFIYRYDGSAWVEEGKLVDSDGSSFGRFVISVSISGDVAVVGAPLDDDNGENSGSAYVFRYDGATWVEEAELMASDGTSVDQFGSSVSISGNVAVIGAPEDDVSFGRDGSAYVFRYDGTAWVEGGKLGASDPFYEDAFGKSVAVSGDVAVVGAEHIFDNFNLTTIDSAYIFMGLSPNSGSTPTGDDVIVEPVTVDESGEPVEDAPAVAMQFDSVTGGGTTTVTATETGPPPPSGFRLGNPPVYLDIETDATFAGELTICVDYSTISFGGDPSKLKLYHFVDPDGLNNPKWVEITTSNNTATMVICGKTSSLSPFAILESADPIELLSDLVDAVAALNAKKGIINSLDAKLSKAREALTDAKANNDHSAINVLMEAFSNAVAAQTGKALTASEADNLLTRAEEIVLVLSFE